MASALVTGRTVLLRRAHRAPRARSLTEEEADRDQEGSREVYQNVQRHGGKELFTAPGMTEGPDIRQGRRHRREQPQQAEKRQVIQVDAHNDRQIGESEEEAEEVGAGPYTQDDREGASADAAIRIDIGPFRANVAAAKRLPYGVMVWGDFRAYRLPAGVPEGTAIVGDQGLFVPFVLQVDTPVQWAVTLRKE